MDARRSGFTLIEVLVVITVIGIVLSVAMIGMGVVTRNDEVQTEVSRFVALVQVAQDESMLQGREFGLEVLQHGYRFVELDPLTRQWAEIFGDDMLGPRQLPESIELELFLDDQRIELEYEAELLTTGDDEDDDDQGIDEYKPHMFVFSSGDLTPFELQFRDATTDKVVRLQANLLGELSIVEDEEL